MITPSSDNISPPLPRPISKAVDATLYSAIAQLSMPNAQYMAFDSVSPSGHTIRIDTVPSSEGENTGPDPKSLLLISLGTCTGMDVISIMRKKRQAVSSYNINVYATEAADHPKVYTSILVEHILSGPKVEQNAVARSIELSITKYCPVHALLSRVVPIEHVYRILE